MQKNESMMIILSEGIIGIIASCLVYFGNPMNMGFCIACFLRDTAGGLSLHSTATVQYIRPEIIGLILGSFIIAFLLKSILLLSSEQKYVSQSRILNLLFTNSYLP